MSVEPVGLQKMRGRRRKRPKRVKELRGPDESRTIWAWSTRKSWCCSWRTWGKTWDMLDPPFLYIVEEKCCPHRGILSIITDNRLPSSKWMNGISSGKDRIVPCILEPFHCAAFGHMAANCQEYVSRILAFCLCSQIFICMLTAPSMQARLHWHSASEARPGSIKYRRVKTNYHRGWNELLLCLSRHCKSRAVSNRSCVLGCFYMFLGYTTFEDHAGL